MRDDQEVDDPTTQQMNEKRAIEVEFFDVAVIIGIGVRLNRT